MFISRNFLARINEFENSKFNGLAVIVRILNTIVPFQVQQNQMLNNNNNNLLFII
jgi:hypothetical protein